MIINAADRFKDPIDRAATRLNDALAGLTPNDAADLLVFAAGEIVAEHVEAGHRPLYLKRLSALMCEGAGNRDQ